MSADSLGVLRRYLSRFPEDAEHVKLLQKQLAAGEDMGRQNFRGHLTAAGIVLNPERTALLLVLHPSLHRWLQPGGHVESADVDMLAAARREVGEETGRKKLEQVMLFDDPLLPIDIDTHYIPANVSKNEPEHYYHDFRYVFIAPYPDEAQSRPEETNEVAWVTFNDKRLPVELSRLITRLHQFGIVPETV